MADNATLAHLSDLLFTSAIATYTVAMACFTAEYAFGRKGRAAAIQPISRSGAPAIESLDAQPDRVLVGSSGAMSAASGASARSAPGTASIAPGGSVSSSSGSAASDSARPVLGRIDSATSSGRSGDRLGAIAIAIMVIGTLLHLSSITLRGIAVDRVPWGNMYEFATLSGFVAVVAFLVTVLKMPQVRYLGGFALFPVVVLMFLAGTVWYVKASPLVPALQSYWLAIHVSAAAASEGVFLTSTVLTVLYLVRSRYDRKAVVAPDGTVLSGRNAIGARLPAAASLDKAAYRAVAFGFPIYTFAVICGAIWAEAAWGRYWGWDPKEVWAFIVWVIFAAYLHARATAGWRGRAAAYINILGFVAMSFNFFVVNVVIAGLHSYSGLNS